MSVYDEIIEGLTIFKKYETNNKVSFSAQHDEIFAGPPSYEITDEDTEKLNEIGWNESEYGGFRKFV